MSNYSIGKILNINNIDFSILSIINYKGNKYVLAMETVQHTIPEHPKIILLKEIENTDSNYGSHFEVVDNKTEIKNVLKHLKV